MDIQILYSREEVYQYTTCPDCQTGRGHPCGWKKGFPWNHISRTKLYHERLHTPMFLLED